MTHRVKGKAEYISQLHRALERRLAVPSRSLPIPTTGRDALIALLQGMLQGFINTSKAEDGFSCLECQGGGYSTHPDSITSEYNYRSEDCPDEVYWSLKPDFGYGPDDEDDEEAVAAFNALEEEWGWVIGHSPDCNGVCDYDLINAEVTA